MMSASSVADNVNKYRHGVLVGNFVEDKFGNDLSAKVHPPHHLGTTTRCSKTTHNQTSP